MKKNKTGYRILLAILIICQMIICFYLGHLKRSFFCDETFSYGLANSENYTFIDYTTSKSNSENGWVTADYFKDYVTVSNDAKLSFAAAFRNQKNDVHPPLYYCLLHIASFINAGVFSKWTGLVLNFIILLIIDYLLFYISNYIFCDRAKSLLSVILWSCSAAGLSNILYIRMYLLQTAELIGYVGLHIYLFTAFDKKGTRKYLISSLLIILNVIIGGLTHYYFYLFAFFFSAPICLYLLIKKDLKDLVIYSSSLLTGFILNLIIFPATLQHVFSGYRGTQVLSNLKDRNDNVLTQYGDWINNSFFGGTVKLFFVIILITIIVKIWRHLFVITLEKANGNYKFIITKQRRSRKDEYTINFHRSTVIFLLSIFAAILFAVAVIQGSEGKTNRYIYPIYPFLSVCFIAIIFEILKQWNVAAKWTYIVTYFITALLCIQSIRVYGIDYQYADYDSYSEKASVVTGYDCLLYCDDTWLDVYTTFPLKFIYDETFFFHPDEIQYLNEILSKRQSDDPIVVCLPNDFSEEAAKSVLSQISAICGYTDYECVYHYYTQAYFMK